MSIRFADFIRSEIEPILEDWEEFAGTIFHARHMNKAGLRDHAREMLLAIAQDLDKQQSDSARAEKAKGCGPRRWADSSAEVHGGDRHASGFSVVETVSEFRALRASVVSHWTTSCPTDAGQQLEDLTRFHEAIDQAVAESLEQYARVREMKTRLFGSILVASPDPIYVMDPEGTIIYANKASADLFALEIAEILGKSNFDLGFPFASEFRTHLRKVISEQCIHKGKLVHSFASGQGERFEYVLAPVLDEYQETEAAVCIVRDVTERALAEEKVWHNAHHDLLTGLPNRRLFLDRMEQGVKHARRSGRSLCLFFIDLNGFKEVNDSLGHEAGDRLLSEVAERLPHCVREEDTVARLGGDEFTVLLTGAEQTRDVELIARTIVDVMTMPFNIAEKPVQVSVSIGISFFPRDAPTPAALLEAADQAMYTAKESGADWVFFADLTDTRILSQG